MVKKKTTIKKSSSKPNASRTKKPKIEEFMEIGGSPLPGITLRHILHGHTEKINRIAWSPDGRYLASPSEDGTIRIWDVEHEECINILKPNIGVVTCVEWSPDGQRMVFGGLGGALGVWESKNNQTTKLSNQSHRIVRSIKWSPDERTIAVGTEDNKISLWETFKWERVRSLKSIETTGFCLVWSRDSNDIASSGSRITQIWNARTGKVLHSFVGHDSSVFSILLIKDELVSGSADRTIRFWDIKTGRQKDKLEGHTENIYTLSCSANERILASKAFDSSIILWDYANRIRLGEIPEEGRGGFLPGISFHPTKDSILATLGDEDKIIRIWHVDYNVLIKNALINKSVRYTTAKLVLVGDSGVGKTGLGWRLAHNEFKEHSSTHGQQFWVVPELKKRREDGTECEAVLWDLAGQPDYRLIHSLYLDDVDTALVLFDPTNRQEPLSGVDFWLNQLKDKDKKLRNSILVGARTDRGMSTLTDSEIQAFCKRNNITGGYIATSAKEGNGLPELMEIVKHQIPWETLPATVTTTTFKRVKEYVLSVKEKPRRRKMGSGSKYMIAGNCQVVLDDKPTCEKVMHINGLRKGQGLTNIAG